MNLSKKAIDIARKSNGILTLKNARENGISNGIVSYLAEKSVFEKWKISHSFFQSELLSYFQ